MPGMRGMGDGHAGGCGDHCTSDCAKHLRASRGRWRSLSGNGGRAVTSLRELPESHVMVERAKKLPKVSGGF